MIRPTFHILGISIIFIETLISSVMEFMAMGPELTERFHPWALYVLYNGIGDFNCYDKASSQDVRERHVRR